MIIKKLAEADPRVAQYARETMDGSVLVCEKIALAIKRCMDDLQKEEDPDFKWRFDAELASRPIRFVEKFMKPQGNYTEFKLMLWQCFFEANLFGWVHKETGERRFRKATLLVGGGNGKTPLIAGTAIYCQSQLGIKDCNVDIFANSKEQAEIMLGDCAYMITGSPVLHKHYDCKVKGIFYKEGGEIRSRASDARKLDGIRPTVALIDEKHEMRNYRLINHCVRSLNKAKENQLMVTLSTMGYVLDGPLVDDYRRGEQILRGVYPKEVAERELVMIYELDAQDDYEDPELWIKANPSLGVLLDIEDLKSTWTESRLVPGLKADFLTKQLNIFTQTDEAGFISFELLERNRDTVDIESLRGCIAYGGIDVGASEDHCGVHLEIEMPDKRLFWLSHTFVPERKATIDANSIPYEEYERMGLLTIVPGEYVKQEVILDWFDEQAKMFNIVGIGYDPANASLLVRALESYRGEGTSVFRCEAVRQGALSLNAPMKHLREQFIEGRIVHNQNSLLEWNICNVRLRKDYKDRQNENWTPVKATQLQKIDAFMAGLNAHAIRMRYCLPDENVSCQEQSVEFYQLSFV